MKIYLDMVGCRLNQSELEAYARQFRLAGHSLTSEVESADLIVINTCTVTAAAASDSRQKIRQSARARSKQVIVTGCFATLNPQFTSEIPGVSLVVDNREKENLVSLALGIPDFKTTQISTQREPIPGARLRTRAFIKVQDGCDNHCTYCITRIARGSSRSHSMDTILADIRSALDGGAQEVVLTGVHLGSWGYDFQKPDHLSQLVRAILSETDVPRLRLSSLEPWDISPDFFTLWQNPRVCRHLHLPLQSGCKNTLKRMGRQITPEAYSALLHQARISIPGVAITTDIITGFPGETDVEFYESLSFVKEMDFSGGHVFTYSARLGTAAALLPDQIPPRISKQRSARMREVLMEASCSYQKKFIGTKLQVLWEKAIPIHETHWMLKGLTDNYLRVCTHTPKAFHNQLMNVAITGVQDGELLGKITAKQNQD